MRNRIKTKVTSPTDAKQEEPLVGAAPADGEVQPPAQPTEDTTPHAGTASQEGAPSADATTSEGEGQKEQDTPPEDDDSWLDELTLAGQEKAPEAPATPAAPQTKESKQDDTSDEKGTAEQEKRLAELYANLEHVDSEVAAEIHEKVVAPELTRLQAKISELEQYRVNEEQARRTSVLAAVNSKILSKYPKAEKILQSKEFMDFVNANNNPYAQDTEFNNLLRAYHAGDADYVLGKIDGFVASRGKPKAPVGVEASQGGGGKSGVSTDVSKKRVMTEAEYLAKRKAIKGAPKGTYPPNALKELVNEFMNSRG